VAISVIFFLAARKSYLVDGSTEAFAKSVKLKAFDVVKANALTLLAIFWLSYGESSPMINIGEAAGADRKSV
jgi:hypothetical protein